MSRLLDAFSLPGFAASTDPSVVLANLDVDRFVADVRDNCSAKLREELNSLRSWVKKLLILLARSKDINVEGSELDAYFVEWVKRQETKRKGESPI